MDLFLNDTKNKKPTLCLNMIVKNESKIIQRLFDSVLPIIDCYCICDTGSTDNTVELITEYFAAKGIPGKIVKEPFKNFCHNRNVALQHSIGMSDYVLLLDADMVLEIKNFDKTSLLNADSFFILQGNDTFYYQNMRIVKNNGLYSYCGVTHEYINTPNNNNVSGFEKNTLFIRDIGDGGAKHDKFERDIKLLLEGIKEEPENERYYFYLANSYHDSHRFEEAINVYKKRIEFGGWIQEVWYSYYRIGLCFKNIGKMDEAIKYWMEGFDFYSERLEGVYEIIKHYRINSKHKLAYLFYEQAQKILDADLNRDSHLFLHNEVYTSKIYYEYTIFAAYIGVKNINNEVVQVLNHSFDNSETNNMLSNMKFYKDVLEQKNKLTLDNKVLSVINNENIDLFSSSSCLIPKRNNDGYLMNIRYVNYEIDTNGSYLNCDKHIISVNKLVELDNNFNVINEKWMNINFDNRRYIGVEDIRIFNDIETNQLLFIGTGLHQNNKIGIVNGIYGIDENKLLEEKEIIPDFANSECEKNWVFVNYNDSTHIIYNWYPVQICKMNENKGVLTRVDIKSTPKLFSYIRGSTSGFKYASTKNSKKMDDDIRFNIGEHEIWFVNHIVSYESPRHYYHIISVFDENMNLLRYSAPFKFEGAPIEYCLSIVVEDERVLINYSTWDRTTRIGIYDKKYIDSIVHFF